MKLKFVCKFTYNVCVVCTYVRKCLMHRTSFVKSKITYHIYWFKNMLYRPHLSQNKSPIHNWMRVNNHSLHCLRMQECNVRNYICKWKIVFLYHVALLHTQTIMNHDISHAHWLLFSLWKFNPIMSNKKNRWMSRTYIESNHLAIKHQFEVYAHQTHTH